MKDLVNKITENHCQTPGGLLPCLHDIQAQVGYIPSETYEHIAHAFSLSVAEVHGVVSFYHDFRTTPAPPRAVQICCAEACQAVGSRDLESAVGHVLGVEFGEVHASQAYRLERVYCLGNCACGPSIRIGDDVHGRVDSARLSELVSEATNR
ncbi:MAG: NAD(P)H-dependent oxidoreductase subunit E [Luminiphilus sp.]|nr:NAD(P)H-dependent oxidoreductase subunit E [Luminiphilus sp.]